MLFNELLFATAIDANDAKVDDAIDDDAIVDVQLVGDDFSPCILHEKLGKLFVKFVSS